MGARRVELLEHPQRRIFIIISINDFGTVAVIAIIITTHADLNDSLFSVIHLIVSIVTVFILYGDPIEERKSSLSEKLYQ